MKTHFAMFANYNLWANNLLYDAVGKLNSAQFNQDCGAFFGSICGTLNHILVGDSVWMSRFQASGDAPKSLDEVPHDTFGDLRADRILMDERIITYINGLDDDDLGSEFTYQTIINPATLTQPLAPALAHFFNHQTHHRGQVHCLLTQLREDAPSLDLIYYLREEMAK